MIAQEYETITLRLPWHMTCALACRAMCLGLDFERIAELALDRHMAGYSEGCRSVTQEAQ